MRRAHELFAGQPGCASCTEQEFARALATSAQCPSIWGDFSVAEAAELFRNIDVSRCGRITKEDFDHHVRPAAPTPVECNAHAVTPRCDR